MSENIPQPGGEPENVALGGADPAWGAGAQDYAQMPITPGVTEAAWGSTAEPAVDRYVMPEPDQIAPTYVRNEAPWVEISGEIANPDLSALADAPVAPGVEPEFTRMLRARRRWRDAVAWAVTGGFIVTAAWFLPILLVPTSPLGRVGSFAALSVGGCVVAVALLQTWRWARRTA